MLKADLSFSHYIDELRETAGFKGVDIANVADVSEATVSRWMKGQGLPHPRTQLVLSDLHYVAHRLREFYTREETRLWLFARHPQLAGARAIDLINEGRTEEVLTVLERLDSGAHL